MPETVMSDEQIFEGVQQVLVDALGVDEEEVVPEAHLDADLGAESIDYLDITFRLEKHFNIRIDDGEMFPSVGYNPWDLRVEGDDDDWVISHAMVEDALLRYPEISWQEIDGWEVGKTVRYEEYIAKVKDLQDVDYVCRFVKRKLAEV